MYRWTEVLVLTAVMMCRLIVEAGGSFCSNKSGGIVRLKLITTGALHYAAQSQAAYYVCLVTVREAVHSDLYHDFQDSSICCLAS